MSKPASKTASAPSTDKPARAPRRPDRKERVPLGTLRLNMTVQPFDGYVLRWVNDVNNRIHDAIEGGYAHVTYEELGDRAIGEYNTLPDSEELGSNVSKVVGEQKNGAPRKAYLMKIHEAWYNEDQDAKARQIDAMEQGLINLEGADKDFSDNTYGDIKIG